eukprot:gene57116-biopygen65482
MDEGKVTIVASLDLAGAFDTLDRDILINKLEETCGITGDALDLIKSYLQGRMQRVRIRDEKGKWMENPWGVPQGSVLGPLLFSLYCADIADAVKSASICQYADDVTLTVTSDTTEGAVELMNKALGEFLEYATGNRLAAEPSKTQLMVCTNKKGAKADTLICEMDGHEMTPQK